MIHAATTRKTPPKFPVVDAAIKEKGNVMDFIRFSGFHQNTYYKMQDGTTQPTLGLIYKVLQYTGLTFDEAFMASTKNSCETHRG